MSCILLYVSPRAPSMPIDRLSSVYQKRSENRRTQTAGAAARSREGNKKRQTSVHDAVSGGLSCRAVLTGGMGGNHTEALLSHLHQI